MYSTTVNLLFVVAATTLATLFAQMVKAYPALEGEEVTNLQLISKDNNADDNGQMQYEQIIRDKLEDVEPVFQKCKRNKRHVHMQKLREQDGISEEKSETPHSTSSPLTDEQILDIELQYQIARIKQKILGKLHLDQPPNVTASKPEIPPELARKIFSTEGHVRKDSTATRNYDVDYEIGDADASKITQIIVIAENATDECDFPETSLCYRFSNPSNTISDDEITSASIWVYVLPDPFTNSNTSQRTLNIVRPEKHYNHRSTLATQLISISEGWVEIKIEHGIHKWAKHEQYVEISFTQGAPSLSSLSSQQPKLELDIQNHVRSARSTTIHRVCHAGTTQCCMQSYTINFADIGWDWIIEPTEYQANYCRGTCSSSGPFTFDHSQVASLKARHMTNQNRGRTRASGSQAAIQVAADLTPCCAPERLDSLSIMYLDANNRVTVDLLPDMIVTSCGCA